MSNLSGRIKITHYSPTALPGFQLGAEPFVLTRNGRIATLADTCYENACDGVAQPDATVSVGTGSCDAECASAAGVYEWFGSVGDPGDRYHSWVWTKVDPGVSEWYLAITYDAYVCQWTGMLEGYFPNAPYGDDAEFGVWDMGMGGAMTLLGLDEVLCSEEGHLTAAFLLPGAHQVWDEYDCEGCSATVVTGT